MRKLIIALLCIQLFTFSAFAVDVSDYQHVDEYGNTITDWDHYNEARAYEMVALAGIDLDVQSYWTTNWVCTYFDFEAFMADYNALVPSEPEPEPEPEPETPPEEEEPTVTPPAEDPPSSDPAVEDDGYSVDTYVGDSEDGEQLTTDETPATEPEQITEEILVEIPAVYTINDMRSSGESSDVVSGLKALIVSIFGEYTPVTTSAAVTETVDGVTTTTLIDVVASGAAGVDYAWIAGVALFGILLYCVMRIFGTVLK